ncbi:uncharacterized protein LOC130644544 [Hydractinia symbiolongicarpus]|uniref:uncharacterized protein LOC130644544 n=1 Tax=Hydractinia symbiolongicarpus TaxID=13093 RepID=UPI00254B091A|nr:uncharacterized protein LOC130644544 [Hydractinia symbiolongicarpus]
MEAILILFYFFGISVAILVFIFTCTYCLSPRKARRWMVKSFKILFEAFCFRLKCNKVTTDMEDIIDRFSAYIPETKRFFKTLEEEYHFRRVLDILNASISEFQFSIMPAGSLREGFGKLQPSTSALASDYDMMLIPEDCFAQFSQGLKLVPSNNTSDTDTIFEAIRPPGTEEAFCWLKLKDDLSPRHEHWKRFTVYKKVNGEDVLVLSNDKVRFELKKQLITAKRDLGYMDALAEELTTGERRENKYVPNIEVNGPAVTIKIKKVEEPRWNNYSTKCFSALHTCTYLCNCCCCCGCFFPLRETGEGRELYSFYSDFTLSLPCKEWPVDAAEWFTRERNWPTNDIVNKIKTSVTHLVPKPSTSLSPITFIESQDVVQEEPDNTQIYGNLPPTGFAQADKSVKKSGVEFRISFSQPEAILASHAPVKTKETYLAFKSTIKRLQEQLNIPGRYKIETFALKSIFYRTLEKLPVMYSFNNTGARKKLLKLLFEVRY